MNSETQLLDKKIELIQWLSSLEDINVINKLFQLRNAETTDWWESATEAEKESISKGLADAENKKLIPHSAVKEQYEKWV